MKIKAGAKKIIDIALNQLAKSRIINLLFWEISRTVNPHLDGKYFTAFEFPEKFLCGVWQINSSSTWKSMLSGEFEPVERRLVKRLAKDIDFFIDIGAHIGYYTCLVGTSSNAGILAIEPNPANFKSLKTNVSLNDIENITIINVALGRSFEKTATLYGNDASGSIIERTFKKKPQDKIVVKTTTLDSLTRFIPKAKKILVKMDIEGGEYDALSGAINFLKTRRPKYLLVEVVKHWSGGVNLNFDKTFELLSVLGYKIFALEKNRSLKNVNDVTSLTGGNYLFVLDNNGKNKKITLN